MTSRNSGADFIVDTAMDAIITTDAEGLITGWNSQAETIFGWSRQEVVGQRLSETIIPHRSREAHNHCLKRFVTTGGHPILARWDANTVLHRDGHEFPVKMALAAVRSGQTFTFTGFFRTSIQALDAYE